MQHAARHVASMQDESHSFEISIVTNHASVVLARLVLHVGDWGRSKQLQKPFLSAAREADLNSLPPKEYEASKVLLFSVPGRQYLGTMIARRIGDWSNRKYRKLRNGRGMCKFVEIQNGRRHVNASRQSLPTWRRTATTTTGETHTAAMDLNHLAVRAARYGTSCSTKVGTPSISVTKRCIWTDRH